MTSERFQRAMASIDAANARDPRRVDYSGESLGIEELYAKRMSLVLQELAPDSGEILRLAVRAQHIRRWEIPRASYPPGRRGYLEWRRRLGAHHAHIAVEIAREAGYSPQEAEVIRRLVSKSGLGTTPEGQFLEDTACLVFIRYYLEDFVKGKSREDLRRILKKSWRKMSPEARKRALDSGLPQEVAALLKD